MNLNKTLEQLENNELPTDAPTELIEKCRAYQKVSLGYLSIEQLRLLIGQRIGLNYIVPIAIQVLASNPLAEGDLYEGDLLMNILRIDKSYWLANSTAAQALQDVLTKHASRIEAEGLKELQTAVLQFAHQ